MLKKQKRSLMRKDLTICGNHKLGCDCTNWDEYRIDKEKNNA